MPDAEIVLQQMDVAELRWRAALKESAFAPPNDDFPQRLRAIALAAEGEAAVHYQAANAPRLVWNPVTTPPKNNFLSYELRPGGNRPGPSELWQEFDAAVTELAQAQAGTDWTAMADQWRAISASLNQLAGALEGSESDARVSGQG